MDLEKQVEQLQAQIESKDSQIAALTRQTQELGAYKAEALNGRDSLVENEQKIAELEADLRSARAEAAVLKSAANTSSSKQASVQKKIAAAESLSKALRDLIG